MSYPFLGGHTHDGIPQPIKVGGTLVINSGAHGKFLSRLDLHVRDRRVMDLSYPFRAVLDDIEASTISDPNDQLAGRLLGRLYPGIVTPKEIARYFRTPKAEYFGGRYQDFWRRRLVARTPREDLSDLLDAWTSLPGHVEGDRYGLSRNHIAGELLAAALAAHGDNVPIETLHRWFGIGLDKHRISRLTEDDAKGAREWLSARPTKLKALVAYGWTQVRVGQIVRRRAARDG